MERMMFGWYGPIDHSAEETELAETATILTDIGVEFLFQVICGAKLSDFSPEISSGRPRVRDVPNDLLALSGYGQAFRIRSKIC
jgi:hypothetical protein